MNLSRRKFFGTIGATAVIGKVFAKIELPRKPDPKLAESVHDKALDHIKQEDQSIWLESVALFDASGEIVYRTQLENAPVNICLAFGNIVSLSPFKIFNTDKSTHDIYGIGILDTQGNIVITKDIPVVVIRPEMKVIEVGIIEIILSETIR